MRVAPSTLLVEVQSVRCNLQQHLCHCGAYHASELAISWIFPV